MMVHIHIAILAPVASPAAWLGFGAEERVVLR